MADEEDTCYKNML